MDRIVDGIFGEAATSRTLSRRPLERNRSKLNSITSTNNETLVQVVVPPVPINGELTDRPYAVRRPARQRKHLLPLLTALTKLFAKKFKLIK